MIKSAYKYLIGLLVILCAAQLFSKIKFEPSLISAPDAAYSMPDTLKIMALRVEFEEDDLPLTTGTGKFNSGYPDTLRIDGLPHDRQYFEDQLEFVKNYFISQSRGSVRIEYTVLDTVVTLDHPIWYYNPNNGSAILLERLVEMYSSAWSAIKDDTKTDFKKYNTFVIYHAGSGQEFNPGYDETPFDIPSVYLSQTDLNGSAVETHDGTLITNTVILPECEWQILDNSWYYAGMGGISCLMFAHRLGIPNMYSSSTGRSCIGKFGLMDQGSANFYGMVPAGVSAWVKELKGWSDVRELKQPESGIVSASDSTMYRINLNRDEYLLIENRTPVNYTSSDTLIYGYDRDGRRIELFTDRDTGAEKYRTEEGFRTIIRIDDDDYDYGLPAGYDLDYGTPLQRNRGGILIWHVDKRKTTQYNIVNNKVNDDYSHRGIYLEEGDGSFDIGKDYWLLDNGYGSELGWFYDAFSSENQYWLRYSNNGLYDVQFSSVSFPRSDTNDGIKTGIKLHDFTAIGREMEFSFSYEEEDMYFSIDPELAGQVIYLPCYMDKRSFHFFCNTAGNYKLFEGDSIVFGGSFIMPVSDIYEPFQWKNNISVVQADSAGIQYLNIEDGNFQTVPTDRIVSQPVAGIVPTEKGLINLEDAFSLIMGTESYTKAKKLMALTDGTGSIVYTGGVNESNLFGIDILSSDVAERTSDPDSTYFILTGSERENRGIIAFPKTSGSSGTVWNDTDSDGRIEKVVPSQNTLSIMNEYAYVENGFPVTTSLGNISRCFVFSGEGNKYVAAVDSSANFGVITSDGKYISKEDRTMPGFNKYSGLLESDGYVYLYNFDGSVLSCHSLGPGTISEYSDYERKVISVSDPSGNVSAGVTSGSVYNWPNPVRGRSTSFRFFLNRPADVKIDLYDINGNRIETIRKKFSGSGEWFEAEWDVSSTPSGIYRAVLDFGSEKHKVKVAVIK